MITDILQIVLSCIVIWKASDGFEVASSYLGRNLNDGVRGATINAVGSSMPELFTTLWFLFALRDTDGFASGIATTAGSAIFNGMIIPAIVILGVIWKGFTTSIQVSRKVIWRDGISLIVANLVLIFLLTGSRLEWWHGLVLMLVYIAYVVMILTTMTKSDKENSIEASDFAFEKKSKLKSVAKLDLEGAIIRKPISSFSAWLLLGVSMLIIGGACALLVHACEGLANEMGIATYFVAIIIASAATSIPDTILSYKDALKGEYDDAVSNALGSNIFDVCFALGFPMLIFTLMYGPIEMSQSALDNVTELRVILLVLTVVAFLIYILNDGMGKIQGFLLLLVYFAFAGFIFAQAYEVQWALDLGAFLRSLIN